jgi:hypothetical protein
MVILRRIVPLGIILVTALWAYWRYHAGGHLVYHAHGDTWWVQNGVPIAHYFGGNYTEKEAFVKNIMVFLKEGKRAIIIGIGALLIYCIVIMVYNIHKKNN